MLLHCLATLGCNSHTAQLVWIQDHGDVGAHIVATVVNCNRQQWRNSRPFKTYSMIAARLSRH